MEIDWTTLLFETINFVVLVFVLWRVLYRPLRRSLEARREALAQEATKAREGREAAERLRHEWQQKHEELEALRASTRAEVLDGAQKERAAMLERAREDASAELARVRQLLSSEREAAERWVEAAIVERGSDLAGRLLLTIAAEAADEALAERLLLTLEQRGSELGALAADEGVPEVELVGARAPAPRLVARLEAVLERAIGRPLRLVTGTDAALLAGWTVRIGDRLFDASVQGELRAFRELARELATSGEALLAEERPLEVRGG